MFVSTKFATPEEFEAWIDEKNNKDTEQAGKINTLETDKINHEDRLSEVESKVATQEIKVSDFESKSTNYNSRLNTLENARLDHKKRLDDLEVETAEQGGKITDLEDTNTEQDGKISTLESKVSTLESRVATIEQTHATDKAGFVEALGFLGDDITGIQGQITDIKNGSTAVSKANGINTEDEFGEEIGAYKIKISSNPNYTGEDGYITFVLE